MRTILLCVAICLMAIYAGCATQQEAKQGDKMQYVKTDTGRWLIHDMNRPAPAVIEPGQPGKAPSDAIVLFDGTDLSQWTDTKGNTSKWILGDGYMESVKGSGYIQSKRQFGSCQLHVEFATPARVRGSSQGRGNSGVFLMGEYEIQVLDSYDNRTYADGQCSALYGRAVPLVNACRKPGQWQTFDIIFFAPVFKNGKLEKEAYVTVLHNGLLVHHNQKIYGPTGHRILPNYDTPIPEKGPLVLSAHNNPVRFRNIWIRPL